MPQPKGEYEMVLEDDGDHEAESKETDENVPDQSDLDRKKEELAEEKREDDIVFFIFLSTYYRLHFYPTIIVV